MQSSLQLSVNSYKILYEANCRKILATVDDSTDSEYLNYDQVENVLQNLNYQSLLNEFWTTLSKDQIEFVDKNEVIQLLVLIMDPFFNKKIEEKLQVLLTRYQITFEIAQQFVNKINNSTISEPIKHIKPNTFESLQNFYMQQLTFNPVINPIGKAKVQCRIEQNIDPIDQEILKSIKLLSSTRSLLQPNDEQQIPIKQVYQGIKKVKTTVDKKENIKSTEYRELQECTFHPKINDKQAKKNTEPLLVRLSNYISPSKKENLSQQTHCFREALQLEKCTFQPEIHQFNPVVPKQLPVGYNETIERMRLANSSKKQQENQMTSSVKSLQKSNIQPPSMLDRVKHKKEPLLEVEILVSLGKKGKLKIYKDDNIREVVERFGKAFSLKGDIVEGLVEQITEGVQNCSQITE